MICESRQKLKSSFKQPTFDCLSLGFADLRRKNRYKLVCAAAAFCGGGRRGHGKSQNE